MACGCSQRAAEMQKKQNSLTQKPISSSASAKKENTSCCSGKGEAGKPTKCCCGSGCGCPSCNTTKL